MTTPNEAAAREVLAKHLGLLGITRARHEKVIAAMLEFAATSPKVEQAIADNETLAGAAPCRTLPVSTPIVPAPAGEGREGEPLVSITSTPWPEPTALEREQAIEMTNLSFMAMTDETYEMMAKAIAVGRASVTAPNPSDYERGRLAGLKQAVQVCDDAEHFARAGSISWSAADPDKLGRRAEMAAQLATAIRALSDTPAEPDGGAR